MKSKNKITWRPVISFSCLLACLFFFSSLISFKTAGILISAIIAILTTFSSLAEEHYNEIKGYWFNKILPETHNVFIISFLVIGSISLLMILENYRLSLKLEKRNEIK